jgi:uroporphyrinogen decarboxylase
MTTWTLAQLTERKPDFSLFLDTLARTPTPRPVLYDLYLNEDLYQTASGYPLGPTADRLERIKQIILAFARLGYDYAAPWPYLLTDFEFVKGTRTRADSISQNENPLILDWESFDRYPWPDPKNAYIVADSEMLHLLPDGMKIVTFCRDAGVLETAIALMGAEKLCIALYDDPKLAQAIFDAIGSRLVTMYDRLSEQSYMGAIVVTDDWGFKTQTLLSTEHMRRYVVPWHRAIVERIHAHGKKAILHSCGNLSTLMDDVIDVIGYDGKHSYEDEILPVEKAYGAWGNRIAILGGIDIDYLCSATPEQVYDRSKALIRLGADKGGLALGTGNSVPTYIPRHNYIAMLMAGLEDQGVDVPP